MRYQVIIDPNAVVGIGKGTTVWGINNNNEIVGSYSTNTSEFGFYEVAGVFTPLFGPAGATISDARGVNDAGQIVGTYENVNGDHFGYLYSGGGYTTLSDPNGPTFTIADGINKSGQVVGWYEDNTFKIHGFLYSGGVNGTYSNVDKAGAFSTIAQGINAAGQIVGYFSDGSGYHGFLDINGTFTTLDDPLANPGTTYAYGINDLGQIVGTYADNAGFHGFRYSGGVYTTLDDPGRLGTTPYGINDAGRIVGVSRDLLATNRGFEAFPNTIDDFNADGSSDLLWRNAGGALVGWSMNGSKISSSSNVTFQGNVIAPDQSWSIAATSDFNGDGGADVLWRQNTGALALWQMNGSTVTSSAGVSFQGSALAPDQSWSVAASGDFNGDGKADLLWRQGSTGSLALWQMNGSSVAASSPVTYQGNAIAPDQSWSVAGSGDFNGDGKVDLLWRQGSTGSLALWLMNGSTVTSSGIVTYQGNTLAPDTSWSVAGVGDFNSDGNADLLWRSAGGALALWQMNGSAVMASGAITCQGNVVAPDASWKVVEIGDFNGDGNSDILWRNTNGSMAEWLMNGSQISASLVPSSQGNPAAPDDSWTVQAKPTNFG